MISLPVILSILHLKDSVIQIHFKPKLLSLDWAFCQ